MKKILCFLVLLGGILFFNTSAKAFTLFQNENKTINEQYIYDKFSLISGFDIELYPHIICASNESQLNCYAYNQDAISSIYLTGTNYNYGRYGVDFSSGNYCHFSINSYKTNDNFNGTQKCGDKAGSSHFSTNVNTDKFFTYSNFDISVFSTSDNSKINKLNFERYSINLNFDENLFANDENFKKVCVDENTKFAITPTNGNYSEDGLYTDFIWFPYGLNNGLYKTQYDSSSEYFEGNVIIDTKDAQYENFYFSDIETINSFYDTDLPSDFEEAGYTDKYSYYGYNAYKFFIVYKDSLFRYPIYIFDNPSKIHISSSGNEHGGGGTRLDGDEEIEITTEYCFYIKKDFEVNEVIIDEWGDFYGTVISPDGDYDFNTSYNKENADSGSFLSQPIKFISEMSDTLTFLNTHIYNFYIAMPLIVRTFIVTALIILIVVLIMKIGGYK